MPNKTLTLEAPDAIFDGTVEALWFNGGAQDGDHLELAKERLRKWLRDETAAYSLAQFGIQQQQDREAYAAGVSAQLDAAAAVLVIDVT